MHGDGPAVSPAEESEALVAPHEIHLRGALPEIRVPDRGAQDRLTSLAVHGLTYHYPTAGNGMAPTRGPLPGVEDVSFTVRRGDFVVITGRVGSGKTTLLRALLGLLPPERGTILWNGARSTTQPPSSCHHAAPTPRRSHTFSARACATTS